MLVYGDAERVERIGSMRAAVAEALARARSLGPGIERHAGLVAAFMALSELVQGIADAAFEATGHDAGSLEEEAGLSALTALARALDRSWRSGFVEDPPGPEVLTPLQGLDQQAALRVKHAEGYAFYALYPETYLDAARCSGLGPETAVIGIRSIGTGLACLVAAALGAEAPITVRPVGHPFRRELRLAPSLAARAIRHPDRPFAVVDEGPGLSGSSFGAVADWLEAQGIPRERIHFFPSHPGDLGRQASEDHRARWSGARRHWVPADAFLLHDPSPDRRLEGWVSELLGPLQSPLEEISGGAWRARRTTGEASWPAANVQQERRKFLARAGGATWLVKFAGLGVIGEDKFRRARALHEAGFAPEPLGLRHGFLVERWIEGAPGLDRAAFDRSRLVAEIGAYLGFRARAFPAPAGSGASLQDLAHMAATNAGLALGPDREALLRRRLADAPAREAGVRRVATDNRLHPHEWLVVGERLIKTDALDHSAAHDLVGCQDIAWDVAGAAEEFGLTAPEIARLSGMVESGAGHPLDPGLVAFLRPCYLAFQLGACTLAAQAVGGAEAVRLQAEAERYRAALVRLLADPALCA